VVLKVLIGTCPVVERDILANTDDLQDIFQ
jgi:hypothetical protein